MQAEKQRQTVLQVQTEGGEDGSDSGSPVSRRQLSSLPISPASPGRLAMLPQKGTNVSPLSSLPMDDDIPMEEVVRLPPLTKARSQRAQKSISSRKNRCLYEEKLTVFHCHSK